MAEKTGPATKVSQELLDKLNEAIAREIQVAVQYMWQHVQWRGVKGFAVQSELKSIAIAEMKHAESMPRDYSTWVVPRPRSQALFSLA